MPRAASEELQDSAVVAAFRSVSNRLTSNLRRLREREGLTQAALAERAGFSHRYIAEIEATDQMPNLTLKALAALAHALQCDPSELLSAALRPRKRRVGRPRAARAR